MLWGDRGGDYGAFPGKTTAAGAKKSETWSAIASAIARQSLWRVWRVEHVGPATGAAAMSLLQGGGPRLLRPSARPTLALVVRQECGARTPRC